MSSLNLQISKIDIVVPRIVQVLRVGIITVPISTVIFRFIPKTDSSQAAGLYALMRNEGGSLGIAFVSTMLQRKSQVHQQMLGHDTNMNFTFKDNSPQQTSSVINRALRLGERLRFDFNKSGASHTVYGVVALRPNLRGFGKILIFEGTSMAGTEAAADLSSTMRTCFHS